MNSIKTSEQFIELLRIVEKLRSPNGCEWDRKQSHESLIPYLIEEVYEVIESIDEKDWNNLQEDGTPNRNTLHEAIPVDVGSKWVITKWFRERTGRNG